MAALPNLDNEYLTLAETAEWLRISERHLQRLLETGDAPPFNRLGRRLIFSRVAVRRWLEARTSPKAPASNEPRSEAVRQSDRRPRSPRNGVCTATSVTGGGNHERP
jgi:excisionase family DNA binding protein